MAISTKLCTAAIVGVTGENLPWKRYSKNKVSLPYVPEKNFGFGICILREFHNIKEPNKIAFVWASEHEILEVRVLLEVEDANEALETGRYGTFIKEEYNAYDMIATVPLVKEPSMPGMPAGGEEDQDGENFEIQKVESNRITAFFGGDWQEPITAEFRLMSDNKFYIDFKTIQKDV